MTLCTEALAYKGSDGTDIVDKDLDLVRIGDIAHATDVVVIYLNFFRKSWPVGGEAETVLSDGVDYADPAETVWVDGLWVDYLVELAVEGKEATERGAFAAWCYYQG